MRRSFVEVPIGHKDARYTRCSASQSPADDQRTGTDRTPHLSPCIQNCIRRTDEQGRCNARNANGILVLHSPDYSLWIQSKRSRSEEERGRDERNARSSLHRKRCSSTKSANPKSPKRNPTLTPTLKQTLSPRKRAPSPNSTSALSKSGPVSY